jgi:hypothetical protein
MSLKVGSCREIETTFPKVSVSWLTISESWQKKRIVLLALVSSIIKFPSPIPPHPQVNEVADRVLLNDFVGIKIS